MGNAIGIIGGSGLYEIAGFNIVEKLDIKTPFGNTSDEIISGKLNEKKIYFIPRHGKGHFIMPSDINFRANIYALKKLNVSHIISISAVGSMREEIKPGDIVIIDQFIDRTNKRISTFFGNGIVAHASFADPICKKLANILYDASKKTSATIHKGGTYLCIEGPQFSTRAESNLYRSWNVDVIGMTNLTEAKLAREAEICYGTLALATDYDCWREKTEDVTIEVVLNIMNKNAKTAKDIIFNAINMIDPSEFCACHKALEHCILTAKDKMHKETYVKLELLIGKYVK